MTTNTTTRGKKALYWLTTVLTVLALCAMGVANLSRAPAMVEGLGHLGYPPYLATLLGGWKLLAAVAIAVPRFPRLQEWAYAGLFFTFTGAAVSHLTAGDAIGHAIAPLVVLGLAMTSWWLRPSRGAAVGAVPQPAQPAVQAT
jgi:uncharacterized membrane protein YphA (DoxX/SURF4 family)